MRIGRRTWVAVAVASGLAGMGAGSAGATGSAIFSMVVSAGASACLPHAKGRVTLNSLGSVETMHVEVSNLRKNTDYDVFVTQVPKSPFGISWYQGHVVTDALGKGVADFAGRFSKRDIRCSAWIRAGSGGLLRRFSRCQPEPSIQPNPDLPPRGVVQLAGRRRRCRLSEQRDTIQRHPHRRYPGAQHQQFPRQQRTLAELLAVRGSDNSLQRHRLRTRSDVLCILAAAVRPASRFASLAGLRRDSIPCGWASSGSSPIRIS